MDRGARVCVGERVGDLGHDPDRLTPVRAGSSQPLVEVGAFEVVRDEIDQAVLHADVVHRHDSGMTQLCEPPCLCMETLGVCLGGKGAGIEDLDGDRTPQLLVLGEEHLAVSTRAERTLDDVSPEGPRGLASGERLRPRCIRRPARLDGLGFRRWVVRPLISHALPASEEVEGQLAPRELIVEEDDQEGHYVKS